MPPLPMRSARFEADDVELLATAQPERGRRYEQIRGGPFRGTLHETSWGSAGLARESWSCGVRVRCNRLSDYVVFSIPSARGDFRWCGASVEPGALLRVDEPWEMTTTLPFGFVCFALDRSALQAVEMQLTGAECALPVGNRMVAGIDSRLGPRLANMLAALATARSEPAALAAAEADLLRLGARLDLTAGLLPVDRLPTPSRRRAAVRRVEEYLDAHGDGGRDPSIPTLCTVAGVSERTLEYAFREQLDTTPVRFLMLRRLNRVRRDLLAPEQGVTVTQIMLRTGVYDLGRFAGEYRQLFGELPSDTLRRGSGTAVLEKPLDPPGTPLPTTNTTDFGHLADSS
jgi:AraC family ethanolamine operon transcriptional activator